MKQHLLRLGTRGSALALAQTRIVSQALVAANPGLEIEAKTIVTTGDRKQGTPSAEQGDKKEWILEIEEALVAGEIDLAIHSGKDVPADIHPDTELVPVLQRESPFDLVIWHSARAGAGLQALPHGAQVGTASLRRRAQLLALRPDLEILAVRGNVPTRLGKLESSPSLSAIVLAEAGIRRLEATPASCTRLSASEMVPAVHQGTLVVQLCKKRGDARDALLPLVDTHTEIAFRAERSCVERLGADCRSAVGIFAECAETQVTLRVRVLSSQGDEILEHVEAAAFQDAEALGAQVAEHLLARGANELLRP